MQSTTSDEVAHRESVGTGAGTDGNDAEKEYERIDHRLITKRVPRLENMTGLASDFRVG